MIISVPFFSCWTRTSNLDKIRPPCRQCYTLLGLTFGHSMGTSAGRPMTYVMPWGSPWTYPWGVPWTILYHGGIPHRIPHRSNVAPMAMPRGGPWYSPWFFPWCMPWAVLSRDSFHGLLSMGWYMAKSTTNSPGRAHGTLHCEAHGIYI